MFRKIICLFLSLFIIFGFYKNAFAAYNSLYYINKINTGGIKNDIKGLSLHSSYVVELDTGINEGYFNKWKGKFIYPEPAQMTIMKNPWDYFGHGSEIAYVMDKIISSFGINNLKTSSNNQPVMIIPYKIVNDKGESEISYLTNAINDVIDYYVVKKKLNIAAINFSSGEPASELSYTDKVNLQKAIDRAATYGITFVTTSGNDNRKIFEYPALSKNVVVVGATNITNSRWVASDGSQGSCYGKALTLVAPGMDVQVSNTGEYSTGTSYSAPMVSTAIALMKAINPTLKTDEIISILKKTSTDLGAKGRDDYFGSGLLNVQNVVSYVAENTLNGQSMASSTIKNSTFGHKNTNSHNLVAEFSHFLTYIKNIFLSLTTCLKNILVS